MIDPARWVQETAARADAAGDDPARLARIVRPLLRDLAWLRALAAQHRAAMAADRWHRPPFAASRHGQIGHLALARAGRVTIGVTLIHGAAARGGDAPPAPPQISFSGQWTMSRLLSADPLAVCRARLAEADRLQSRRQRWRPGTILTLDERHDSLWLAPPQRAACLLRVRVKPVQPVPARSFDLLTGRPLARIEGDEAAARTSMMMSVLRALEDRRAVPLFATMVEERQGPARWSVMREWLALDLPSAWPRLIAMAREDADAALRTAAAQLIARLAPAQAA